MHLFFSLYYCIFFLLFLLVAIVVSFSSFESRDYCKPPLPQTPLVGLHAFVGKNASYHQSVTRRFYYYYYYSDSCLIFSAIFLRRGLSETVSLAPIAGIVVFYYSSIRYMRQDPTNPNSCNKKPILGGFKPPC